MDLKGFLIQYVEHLLNVREQLGPLKHSIEMSQITWIGFTDLISLQLWGSEQNYVPLSDASEMNLAVQSQSTESKITVS